MTVALGGRSTTNDGCYPVVSSRKRENKGLWKGVPGGEAMSTTLMQPSQDEIQREVENIRDIKRRSTLQGGPGVLILDPDLPSPGAQAAAAQASYWNPSSDDSSSDSHSHEDASGSDSASDDPLHLFWVPANMHPEIDPGQFRAFLKEHARTPTEATLGRSESISSASSLGRKKSMLSRQYRPSENDGIEDERVVPLRRNRSSLYASSGPQLTIKDLEKLDELVEEASQSRDPSKLRSVLRRSLSMNISPSVVDNLDHAMPDLGEDADAPIIVPRPGQILRRSARTKIRKQGQTGEGAHRFNATRRGAGSKRATPPPVPDPRSSSDLSTSDHDHDQSDAESPRRQRLLSNESLDGTSRSGRPESYSVEAFIFDAYARDDGYLSAAAPTSPTTFSIAASTAAITGSPRTAPPIQVLLPVQPAPVLPPLQHPLPQRASSLNAPTSVETPSRSPSPVATIHADHSSSAKSESRPAQTSSTSSPPALPGPQGSDSRREKDKDKDKIKRVFSNGAVAEKRKARKINARKKRMLVFSVAVRLEKEARGDAPAGLAHGQSGRDAAVALLGASKSSRGYVPPASPQPQGVNNYSRYPIHVERAIYRLSHIKLANPRRALYEQTQQPQSQQQQTPQQQQQTPTELGEVVTDGSVPQKEQEEKERVVLEQAESQPEAQQPLPQGRRASLTKTPPANAGSRRAEQPVRGPQYDMQHRAMEQEYGAVFAGGARSTNGPPGIGYAAPPGAMQMPGPTGAAVSTPPLPPALSAGGTRRTRSPPPPVGSGVRYVPPPPPPALPQPQAHATTPMASTSSNPTPSPTMSAAAAILAASEGAPARGPARSLSANAVPPVGPRGQGRKAQSAHAVTALGARRPRTTESPGGEEEDVPLALWQQQQQQHQQSLLTQQPRRR
ncbi:hypothetical protein BJV77DRAFT_963520 [Russula vinacea]|nr:hypothetical protein BJV77DRAFT_963520 [Russula vinacea]